jgi:hypothetical protein
MGGCLRIFAVAIVAWPGRAGRPPAAGALTEARRAPTNARRRPLH